MTVDAQHSAAPVTVIDAKQWARNLARYRAPSHRRSIFEIIITFVPFAGLWALGWAAIHFGYWPLSFLPSLLAAGFLVRLFMIQHDCGHGAFFRHRLANDWVGRIIGGLTLTPYDTWRREHAIHHATVGHLDRRGIGDVATLTVREYQALPYWRRLGYRLYRHPLILFIVGSTYVFVLRHRLPLDLVANRLRDWLSVMATNFVIAAIVALLIWLIGVGPFLLLQSPITLVASAIGVWLFFVQHQFDGTCWAGDEDWNLHEAALHGSSHYDLPRILRWFTANIGMHHIHHLCSRIPYYRLAQVLRDLPDLRGISRVTMWQSLLGIRLALWDETRRQLITFRDADMRSTSTRRPTSHSPDARNAQ